MFWLPRARTHTSTVSRQLPFFSHGKLNYSLCNYASVGHTLSAASSWMTNMAFCLTRSSRRWAASHTNTHTHMSRRESTHTDSESTHTNSESTHKTHGNGFKRDFFRDICTYWNDMHVLKWPILHTLCMHFVDGRSEAFVCVWGVKYLCPLPRGTWRVQRGCQQWFRRSLPHTPQAFQTPEVAQQ